MHSKDDKLSQPGFFSERRAGIVLHPTSLPVSSPYSPNINGELGQDAYRFVDFMRESGLSIWQLLPLSPTHEDLSPYMGLSVFAGNERLISISQLLDWNWIDEKTCEATLNPGGINKQCVYDAIAARIFKGELPDVKNALQDFETEHRDWLDNYALFRLLREKFAGKSWYEWPQEYRDRESEALTSIVNSHAEALQRIRIEQFIFFHQWHQLRDYAGQRNIKLYGDIPIFVAYDSAEVWAHREYFDLLDDGSPRTVAGVPPDYFSETGQLWGNPLYRWDVMQADGFSWWKDRMRVALTLYDVVRIDHFRGFESYWEIDANAETAIEGRWVKAPGPALFDALITEFGDLPIVVEDLGIITPQVEALRDSYGWPGMKILQFAFDGNPDNPYLPHNFGEHCVVYSGTHDNDTTRGWFESLEEDARVHVLRYLNSKTNDMPWPIIDCAVNSSARWAVFPMQDFLALDSGGRMNTPGVSGGNWRWRFQWQQVQPELPNRIYELLMRNNRIVDS